MALILRAQRKAEDDKTAFGCHSSSLSPPGQQRQSQAKTNTPERSGAAVEIENDDEPSELGGRERRRRSGRNRNRNRGDRKTKNNHQDRERIGTRARTRSRTQIGTMDVSSNAGKVNIVVVDDDDTAGAVLSPRSPRHRVPSQSQTEANASANANADANVLTVVLNDHSPEAVKILLEYCYTNRVVSLGHDAFVRTCKTRPTETDGPVPPCDDVGPKGWPNLGFPTVLFSVALSAIRLAEEAGMHRLSLMCEISAAHLVSLINIVEVLAMSTLQKSTTGNDLPHLRRAAMEMILRRGPGGVTKLGRSGFFKRALEEQKSIVVPALLKGAMEYVCGANGNGNGNGNGNNACRNFHGGRRKTNDNDNDNDNAIEHEHEHEHEGVNKRSCSSGISDLNFEDLDLEDAHRRARERKRRKRRPVLGSNVDVKQNDDRTTTATSTSTVCDGTATPTNDQNEVSYS